MCRTRCRDGRLRLRSWPVCCQLPKQGEAGGSRTICSDFRLPLALRDRRHHLPAEPLQLGATQLKRLQLRTGDWIDRLAVYPQLKVQMRSCRVATAAHEADKLTTRHLLARLNAGGESHQMTIDGREFLSVLNAKPIAVPTIGLSASHHPIGRGIDRGTGLR